jgi:serine/threonine-protein kinase
VLPLDIVLSVVSGTLHGLHAAHEAQGNTGEVLGIVHRDISPQNILVGVDGSTRVLDFGIAKAVTRVHATRDGQLKGKLAYMAPEQAAGRDVDRRTDVFATGVVLWEALAGKRLFQADDQIAILNNVVHKEILPPSVHRSEISPELDAVVLKALKRDPNERFQSAGDFAAALEATGPLAAGREVARLVRDVCAPVLEERTRTVTRISQQSVDEASDPNEFAHLLRPGSKPDIDREATETTIDAADISSTGQITQGGWLGGRHSVERRRRIGWVTALGLSLTAVIAVAYVGFGRRSAHNETTSSAATGQTAPSGPSASSPSAADSSPIVPLESLPLASASASSEAAAATVGARKSATSLRTTRTKTKPANCKDPMYIGADGIKHYKRECL